jgi:hypothetical protein
LFAVPAAQQKARQTNSKAARDPAWTARQVNQLRFLWQTGAGNSRANGHITDSAAFIESGAKIMESASCQAHVDGHRAADH